MRREGRTYIHRNRLLLGQLGGVDIIIIIILKISIVLHDSKPIEIDFTSDSIGLSRLIGKIAVMFYEATSIRFAYFAKNVGNIQNHMLLVGAIV